MKGTTNFRLKPFRTQGARGLRKCELHQRKKYTGLDVGIANSRACLGLGMYPECAGWVLDRGNDRNCGAMESMAFLKVFK